MQWTKHLDDYTGKDGWGLFYSFRNFGSSFDIASIAEDDHYLVRVAADKTILYEAGIYWWQATIYRGDENYIINDGTLEIKSNLALLDSYDGRSHVKKTLDALEATILGKASRDQMGYSIAGRSITRLSPAELLRWRDLYKAEYAREVKQGRLSKGLSSGSIIKVRF